MGYLIATRQFGAGNDLDLLDFVAAVGARGLAMALNRIIDRDIDAANPRTQGRHLASGSMSMRAAWALAAVFLAMLLISAGLLNRVALMMAWLPVLTFVIYPYMKRFTWGCHFWLGLCLGLAPAGAWVAIAADVHGWGAITGLLSGRTEFLWAPTILPICIGVALWIAAFDINYARMDVESDREQGIHSFPSNFGETATTRTTVQLSLLWFACFAIADRWTASGPRCCRCDGAGQHRRCASMERLPISKRCSSGCRCSPGGCCWSPWSSVSRSNLRARPLIDAPGPHLENRVVKVLEPT